MEQKDVDQTESQKREKEGKIRQILQELLESEKNYVRDLNQICREYLQPLPGSQVYRSLDRSLVKSSRKKSQADLEVESPSNAELRQIFSNIRDLKDYHERYFLPKLQESINQPMKLRELFTSEHSKLTRKYGRYCINYNFANKIIKKYLNYFSCHQFENNLNLRIDGQLIKPVQRITRYQLFLNSLSSLSSSLCLAVEYEEYRLACQSIVSVAEHTNTMMWVGSISDCPHDLSAQGQLLKFGPVQTKSFSGSLRKDRLWQRRSRRAMSCYLFLFQQNIILCSSQQNPGARPHLAFLFSLSVNQVRIRDTVEESESMFEIHRLENMKVMSDVELQQSSQFLNKLRILCESSQNKNSWVSSINTEIRQLKSLAKSLAFD